MKQQKFEVKIASNGYIEDRQLRIQILALLDILGINNYQLIVKEVK